MSSAYKLKNNSHAEASAVTEALLPQTPVDQLENANHVSLQSPCGSGVNEEDTRETWGTKLDFLLSIIGFAVDLANVWRFPYLCFRNGGGAFLIPYFIMLIFGALPLFYMELILGQYHRLGAIGVWKICPIFKGIGVSQNIVAFLVALYYNVIIAWCFYYLFNSLTTSLPWMHCYKETFSTNSCITSKEIEAMKSDNVSYSNDTRFSIASDEFFERGVLGLHMSSGIHDIGSPRWQLVLCTMLVFTILYFALWKGVKTSGKVVYVTAIMPYIILSILLVNGALLPGSRKGIIFFIEPRFERLYEPQVWIDAAVQIFYSTGAGFGVHIAYASYNKRDNQCYRDCLITAVVNSMTSLFAGFVVFSYLGYMSFLREESIELVANEGPGLVFQIYPFAIGTLSAAPFWSIIFFILLITLGLDSAMGGMESLLTGVCDVVNKYVAHIKWHREGITAIAIFTAFLLSLCNVTPGGMYVFQLLDRFAAGTSLLFGVFFQAVAVSWFYGLDQFCSDVREMLGFSPGIYWRICWKIISPLFILIIIICTFIFHEPFVYKYGTNHPELNFTISEDGFKFYTYPSWSIAVGWLISCTSMVMIPIIGIWTVLKKKNLALAISPEWEHESIEKGDVVKRYQLKHWFSLGPPDYWPVNLWRRRRRGKMENSNQSQNVKTLPETDNHNAQVNSVV